ncbi:hypothetical protein ABPG72_008614 [Tetrahymena utriculariae]
MSKKFRDRILEGTGVSNKKFECDFGLKMLQKMGWKGNGLGREQQGQTECIQIKKREEGLGLGVDENKKKFEWNDTWWENHYNNAVKTVGIIKNEDTENTSDQSSSDEEKSKKQKKVKKVVSTKKQTQKQNKYDHLFSSCSSSSDEEPVYKKKKYTAEPEKTKKIKKGSEEKSSKKQIKLLKQYSAESESDDE